MAISFPSLPETVRLPFAYAEFDPTGASDDPALMPYTCLMVGQMLDTGTAEAYSVQRPMSRAQADTLFGQGSQLAAMCGAYLNANNVTRMLAIPVPDAEEGEAAQGGVTIEGAVTAAAPVCLYIGGVLVRAAAGYGSAAADVAANLANAVNANPDLPVRATHSLGQVTLTARHKGEAGNDIDLRLSYYDEPLPGGLTITITALSGGAGNPDAAPVIAAMGNDQYHVIAWPWTDAASLAVCGMNWKTAGDPSARSTARPSWSNAVPSAR